MSSWPHFNLTRARLMWLEFPNAKKISTAKGEYGVGSKVFLELTAGKVRGFGEVPALSGISFGAGTLEEVTAHLIESALPALKFGWWSDPRSFDAALEGITQKSAVSAALSAAYWDLSLQLRRSSVGDIFPPNLTRVAVTDFLRVADPSASPFPRYKVSSLDDIKQVLVLAGATSPKLQIIDCNQAFSTDDLKTLNELLSKRAVLVEEPFSVNSNETFESLSEQINFAWAVDETLMTGTFQGAAQKLAMLRRPPVFCLKLVHVGTISALVALSGDLLKRGCLVRFGGMFESGLGRSINLSLASHFALALPSDAAPPSGYLTDDILETPLIYLEPGYCQIKPGIGLYPVIDERKLERYKVQELTIELE